MSSLTLEDRVAMLEQQVATLRAAREADRQNLQLAATAIQAERDVYLRSLYAWAQQQFTEKELRDYPEEEGVDFGQFLAQLEQPKGA